jgi:hypothetical protein
VFFGHNLGHFLGGEFIRSIDAWLKNCRRSEIMSENPDLFGDNPHTICHLLRYIFRFFAFIPQLTGDRIDSRPLLADRRSFTVERFGDFF